MILFNVLFIHTSFSLCLSLFSFYLSLSSLSLFLSLTFSLSLSFKMIKLFLSLYLCRYKTYEVLKEQTANPRINWAYLPYSMHMAGPRGKY